MKTRNAWLTIPLMMVFLVGACSSKDDLADAQLFSKGPQGVLTGNTCLDSFPYESLSAAEIQALEQLREEELLARDVYDHLYAVHGIRIFDNISNSEQQHADMVGALLTRYSLPDPAANHVPGVFADTTIQGLYNSLISAGSASLLDAMIVGATIEDLDIYDLEHLVATVIDNQDITWVFGNLERGSRNHMRSFYSQVLKRGGSYTPQFISPAYFQQIVSSPHEGGTGCP